MHRLLLCMSTDFYWGIPKYGAMHEIICPFKSSHVSLSQHQLSFLFSLFLGGEQVAATGNQSNWGDSSGADLCISTARSTARQCFYLSHSLWFPLLAQDVIYRPTSRAYATMLVSVCPFVCPSVCDVCAMWSQGAMDSGYLCMLG